MSQPDALGQPAQHSHAAKRNDLSAVEEGFYVGHVPKNRRLAGVEITVTGEPAAEDVAAVRAGVVAHNVEVIGAESSAPLAVLARPNGTLVAGATGFTHSGWLYVHDIWVADELRGTGLGQDILGRAEAEARHRGCHAVWLDTFSFQAPGFYESSATRSSVGSMTSRPASPVTSSGSP